MPDIANLDLHHIGCDLWTSQTMKWSIVLTCKNILIHSFAYLACRTCFPIIFRLKWRGKSPHFKFDWTKVIPNTQWLKNGVEPLEASHKFKHVVEIQLLIEAKNGPGSKYMDLHGLACNLDIENYAAEIEACGRSLAPLPLHSIQGKVKHIKYKGKMCLLWLISPQRTWQLPTWIQRGNRALNAHDGCLRKRNYKILHT